MTEEEMKKKFERDSSPDYTEEVSSEDFDEEELEPKINLHNIGYDIFEKKLQKSILFLYYNFNTYNYNKIL